MTLVLDIAWAVQDNYDGTFTVNFNSGNPEIPSNVFQNQATPFTKGPLDAANAVFPTSLDAANYYFPTLGPAFITGMNNFMLSAFGFANYFSIGNLVPYRNDIYYGKQDKLTGTTGQYVRGDGSLATLPSAGKLVSGITTKSGAFPVVKSATVASGVAVFHFTTDGLATGTALFPNGPEMDSITVIVNDATASYQQGWAWSNSNKTLTVTMNKLTTANILTGLLGQAAANGAVVKCVVWGS